MRRVSTTVGPKGSCRDRGSIPRISTIYDIYQTAEKRGSRMTDNRSPNCGCKVVGKWASQSSNTGTSSTQWTSWASTRSALVAWLTSRRSLTSSISLPCTATWRSCVAVIASIGEGSTQNQSSGSVLVAHGDTPRGSTGIATMRARSMEKGRVNERKWITWQVPLMPLFKFKWRQLV